MSKFKTLIDKSVLEADTKTMQKITAVMDDHLEELEIEHPDMYWDLIHELHEIVNGERFDEATALWAVSQMKNEDGTTGQHWTEAETTSVAMSNSVQFDTFNMYDWYYVMNMIYSDFYPIIGSDTAMYVRMAKLWIMDKDVSEGKAWRYFTDVAC